MKARLTNKLHLLKPIFEMVAATHHISTIKYEPNGWERSPFESVDASALCDLDAILRHTLKLCTLENYEEQSGLPHVAHVICRVQMAITSIQRGDKDSVYNSISANTKLDTDQMNALRQFKIGVVPCVSKYITPNFIEACMSLSLEDLKIDQSRYKDLKDMYSVHRTWLTIYFDLLLADISDELFCQELLKQAIDYVLYCTTSMPELLDKCRESFTSLNLVNGITPDQNWMVALMLTDKTNPKKLECEIVNISTDSTIDLQVSSDKTEQIDLK